jgi:hypothetical protein
MQSELIKLAKAYLIAGHAYEALKVLLILKRI